jgi:hypothetical protein
VVSQSSFSNDCHKLDVKYISDIIDWHVETRYLFLQILLSFRGKLDLDCIMSNMSVESYCCLSSGNAHSSGAPEFIPRFNWSSCWSICSSWIVFYRLLFVIWSFFLLSIISSVLLRLTASATHLLSTNLSYQEYTPLKLWLRIPLMARCTRYNITWYSLSVTCGRPVVFSGCPGSFHQ